MLYILVTPPSKEVLYILVPPSPLKGSAEYSSPSPPEEVLNILVPPSPLKGSAEYSSPSPLKGSAVYSSPSLPKGSAVYSSPSPKGSAVYSGFAPSHPTPKELLNIVVFPRVTENRSAVYFKIHTHPHHLKLAWL